MRAATRNREASSDVARVNPARPSRPPARPSSWASCRAWASSFPSAAPATSSWCPGSWAGPITAWPSTWPCTSGTLVAVLCAFASRLVAAHRARGSAACRGPAVRGARGPAAVAARPGLRARAVIAGLAPGELGGHDLPLAALIVATMALMGTGPPLRRPHARHAPRRRRPAWSRSATRSSSACAQALRHRARRLALRVDHQHGALPGLQARGGGAVQLPPGHAHHPGGGALTRCRALLRGGERPHRPGSASGRRASWASSPSASSWPTCARATTGPSSTTAGPSPPWSGGRATWSVNRSRRLESPDAAGADGGARCATADRRTIEEIGLPGAVLMENAGAAVARARPGPLSRTRGGRSSLCGKGNNGGDGFVVARRLLDLEPAVFLFGHAAGGAGRRAPAPGRLERCGGALRRGRGRRRAGRAVRAAASGATWPCRRAPRHGPATRRPRARWRRRSRCCARRPRASPVVAVDIPSGVPSDSGRARRGPRCTRP